MNTFRQNGLRNEAASPAEVTLRLLAGLPAPEGLEDRVRERLRAASISISSAASAAPSARTLCWPQALRPGSGWMQSAMRSSLARTAAAAAIVFVVIGGGWSVSSRVQSSRVHLDQPVRAVVLPPRIAAPGGFSSAGAMRTPRTLNGPLVAHPATAGLQTARAADKTPVKKTAHRGKSAVAKKSVTQPAMSPLSPRNQPGTTQP